MKGRFWKVPPSPRLSAVESFQRRDLYKWIDEQSSNNAKFYTVAPGEDLQAVSNQMEDGNILILQPGVHGTSKQTWTITRRLFIWAENADVEGYVILRGAGSQFKNIHFNGQIKVDAADISVIDCICTGNLEDNTLQPIFVTENGTKAVITGNKSVANVFDPHPASIGVWSEGAGIRMLSNDFSCHATGYRIELDADSVVGGNKGIAVYEAPGSM